MEVRKVTAIGLGIAAIGGAAEAEVRDHPAAVDVSSVIAHDAGALGGTVVYQVADVGFVTLDSRTPVEVRQGRYAYRDPYYRGGSII
jgi:hypothetical protein